MSSANEVIREGGAQTETAVRPAERLLAAQTGAFARRRVVIVADDCQFLDTLHVQIEVLMHEYVVAVTRAQILQLVKPEPEAVVVDLQMKSLDPLAVLQLLAELKLQSQIVLVADATLANVASAKRLGQSMALRFAGILERPLSMNALVQLLGKDARSAFAITPDEVRTALANDEFTLHYQPIVVRDDAQWRLRSVEALLRWQHPARGMIFPGQFLPIATAADLMGPLTDWVLTEAVKQASVWERHRLDLAVTVNLAPDLIRDPGFANKLLALLRDFDVAPAHLVLEVIEANSIRDREMLRDAMTRLRLQGIGLSLDDFGTGHSSLTELCGLPYTELKIDRSLVNGLPARDQAATIVNALIDLAHRLSIRVCAEGVETHEAFEYLDRAGCDEMQGIYIVKPLPAKDITDIALESLYWEPPPR